MKKETLADRLNEAMTSAGMSQGALAKASGIAQPTIWRLVSGNARGSTKIVEIANALGVRSEWLSTGNGPMRDDGQLPRAAQVKSQDTDAFRIDVLDLVVSAGPGIVNQEFVEILHSVEYAPAEARHMFDGRKAENIRIINVRGDSMSGTIEPGDLLFVDISVKSFDGDGIYAFLYDDTAHVKRLQTRSNITEDAGQAAGYLRQQELCSLGPDRKRRDEPGVRVRQGDRQHATDIQETWVKP